MKIVTSVGEVKATSAPHGFWRFAANYLLAARAVDVKIHAEPQLFFPALQLYGVSIELSLKAFLLKRGHTVHEVKQWRHDLSKLITQARRRKLGRCVQLGAREIAAIRILNITYASNQLRYIQVGATKVPQFVYIARAAKKLVLGLEFLCTGVKGRLEHVV